ncbi:hypothetical protein AC1031_003619 [Aphanomyces cochlioides]|nr:hypothetical protein AC1031_003619 [Aphanomyces cochlioides]
MKHDHAWKRSDLSRIPAALLTWYDLNRRCLPWRGDSPPFLVPIHSREPGYVASNTVSPYATWVSEIMCQQTRVDTVVQYFTKWMEVFPTIETLANADPDQVNSVWAGLGYYRRARMLHQGAKYVMEKFNGEMPSDVESLKSIPGIGPYTAGAIASVAFQQVEPLVDGNVIRVFSRLRAIGGDPNHKPLLKHCWDSGKELIDENRPGDFNQALMELGATVCSIQTPSCESCPVKDFCLAYAQVDSKKKSLTSANEIECSLCDLSRLDEWGIPGGPVTQYPLKTRKKAPRNEVLNVVVLYQQNSDDIEDRKYLMMKRAEGGLLAGQWEFPSLKVCDDEESIPVYKERKPITNDQLASVLSTKADKLDALIVHRRDQGELVHIFSHVKHHMGIEEVQVNWPDGRLLGDDSVARWMTCDDMKQVGITTGMKKVLQLVTKVEPKGRSKNASSRSVKAKVAASNTKPITSFFQFAAKDPKSE